MITTTIYLMIYLYEKNSFNFFGFIFVFVFFVFLRYRNIWKILEKTDWAIRVLDETVVPNLKGIRSYILHNLMSLR